MSRQDATHRFLLVLFLWALTVIGGGWLRADVLYLKNGEKLEGRVTYNEKEMRYTIETGTGVVRLDEDQVLRHVRSKAPADVFEERFDKLPKGEIEPLLELADWARERRLREQLRRTCREILELDPNDEMARRELGYVVFANTWVLERELRKKKGLVKSRGEWMTAAERDRREREEARGRIDSLFQRVSSENPWIRRYAVEELLAYRGPHARGLFAGYLKDSRELSRILAASLLTNFPARGEEPSADPEAVEITAELYRMFLGDRSRKELQALSTVLLHFHPAEAFRLGVKTLQHAKREAELRRAETILHQVLRKAWVPALCRALVTESPAAPGRPGKAVRHPAVLDLLKRELDTNHGFDTDAWLRWWKLNAHRFQDS